jgi:hypothetical protein
MFPVHFGLGNATSIDGVEIRWPSGEVQQLDGAQLTAMLKDKRQIQITEGNVVVQAR